jgi:hypothetical protein
MNASILKPVPKVWTVQLKKLFSTSVPRFFNFTATIVLISNNGSDFCSREKQKAVDWGDPETEKKERPKRADRGKKCEQHPKKDKRE